MCHYISFRISSCIFHTNKFRDFLTGKEFFRFLCKHLYHIDRWLCEALLCFLVTKWCGEALLLLLLLRMIQILKILLAFLYYLIGYAFSRILLHIGRNERIHRRFSLVWYWRYFTLWDCLSKQVGHTVEICGINFCGICWWPMIFLLEL